MKLDRRRSSLEIIADMLRLGEAGKTEIMYSVNMSYFQLQKYLGFLLDRGLIDKVKLSVAAGRHFRSTPRAQRAQQSGRTNRRPHSR